MTISMYQASVPVFVKGLTNLKAILEKTLTHAQEKKIDDTVFVNARLFPDMLPLSGQIQIATDMARGTTARLSGSELPKWEDDEKTMAELIARIDKTLDYLRTFTPAQIDGTDGKAITRASVTCFSIRFRTSIFTRRRPTASCAITVSPSASWISWAASTEPVPFRTLTAEMSPAREGLKAGHGGQALRRHHNPPPQRYCHATPSRS